MSVLEDKIFTTTLVGATSLSITPSEGITQFTINVTVGTATLVGTKKIGALSSTPITLKVGQPFNGSVTNGFCNFTITVPVGSTVEFAAL